jgi:hypothetical protein
MYATRIVSLNYLLMLIDIGLFGVGVLGAIAHRALPRYVAHEPDPARYRGRSIRLLGLAALKHMLDMARGEAHATHRRSGQDNTE